MTGASTMTGPLGGGVVPTISNRFADPRGGAAVDVVITGRRTLRALAGQVSADRGPSAAGRRRAPTARRSSPAGFPTAGPPRWRSPGRSHAAGRRRRRGRRPARRRASSVTALPATATSVTTALVRIAVGGDRDDDVARLEALAAGQEDRGGGRGGRARHHGPRPSCGDGGRGERDRGGRSATPRSRRRVRRSSRSQGPGRAQSASPGLRPAVEATCSGVGAGARDAPRSDRRWWRGRTCRWPPPRRGPTPRVRSLPQVPGDVAVTRSSRPRTRRAPSTTRRSTGRPGRTQAAGPPFSKKPKTDSPGSRSRGGRAEGADVVGPAGDPVGLEDRALAGGAEDRDDAGRCGGDRLRSRRDLLDVDARVKGRSRLVSSGRCGAAGAVRWSGRVDEVRPGRAGRGVDATPCAAGAVDEQVGRVEVRRPETGAERVGPGRRPRAARSSACGVGPAGGAGHHRALPAAGSPSTAS